MDGPRSDEREPQTLIPVCEYWRYSRLGNKSLSSIYKLYGRNASIGKQFVLTRFQEPPSIAGTPLRVPFILLLHRQMVLMSLIFIVSYCAAPGNHSRRIAAKLLKIKRKAINSHKFFEHQHTWILRMKDKSEKAFVLWLLREMQWSRGIATPPSGRKYADLHKMKRQAEDGRIANEWCSKHDWRSNDRWL